MRKRYLILLLVICSSSLLYSQQSFEAVLIDSTTQKTIPYATITYNNSYGVISNNSGLFLMNTPKNTEETDSLLVSCLGYNSKQILARTFTDSIIYLQPKTFELNEVVITKENYTANEIIELVKEHLTANYDLSHAKRTLFYRASDYTDVLKSNIKLKESTIPEFNQQFIDSLINAIPKKSDSYTEILGNMYGGIELESPIKFDIIKASMLYDKNNEVSFEAFEERINSVIKKRVKKDSYFKIKSGIFGTKEEMDTTIFNNSKAEETALMIEEQKKKEKERKENFLKYRKNSINNLEHNSFIFEDTELNFIEKSNKYEFQLEDHAFLNNNYVYKLTFTPKRGAKYSGVLYINPSNFAVERVDYKNVKSLKDFGLLGISYDQYLHKGTLIYSNNNSEKYVLKYAEESHGNKFGIKRPLTIIEKNKNVKGRRKQNEMSAKLHFIISNVTKFELVVFENNKISEIDFDNFKEKASVIPTYLPKYDPGFWQGYNVIEPNQAIKDFKSIE